MNVHVAASERAVVCGETTERFFAHVVFLCVFDLCIAIFTTTGPHVTVVFVCAEQLKLLIATYGDVALYCCICLGVVFYLLITNLESQGSSTKKEDKKGN
jgi:hypothetical protein